MIYRGNRCSAIDVVPKFTNVEVRLTGCTCTVYVTSKELIKRFPRLISRRHMHTVCSVPVFSTKTNNAYFFEHNIIPLIGQKSILKYIYF